MMNGKTAFPLADAKRIAARYMEILEPGCVRIEIAGSIRRQKPVVGDIELVAIPKMRIEHDLFGEVIARYSLLDETIKKHLLPAGGRLLKHGPRYKQIALREGINLDLFIVQPPAQWGVIFTLRTGPGKFSKWIVTQRRYGGRLPNDCQVKDGAVWRGGKVIPMPEEDDFLRLLNLAGLPPEQRRANLAP